MLVGILSVFLGMLSILAAVKGMSINNRIAYITGGSFLTIGVIVCVLKTIGYNIENICVLAICIGCLFILYSLVKMLKRLRCTEEAQGLYIGASEYHSNRLGYSYDPEFKVNMNNKYYQNTTGENFRKRYIDRNFRKGKRYKVYVNPNNPYEFVTRRRISLMEIILIVMGLIFIWVAIANIHLLRI